MSNWNVTMMKERAIESAEVARALSGYVGPGQAAYWPEMPFVQGDDLNKLKRSQRWRPSARMIAEAEEFDGWCNAELGQWERGYIREWALIKTSPKRTLRGWYEKLGLREHEYSVIIGKIFQKLVENRSVNAGVSLKGALEYAPKIEEDKVSSERSVTHWRADDAKPVHEPDSEAHARTLRKLLQRQQRNAASPRAA